MNQIEKVVQDKNTVDYYGRLGFCLLLTLVFIVSVCVTVTQIWIWILMNGSLDDPENAFARNFIWIFDEHIDTIHGGY